MVVAALIAIFEVFTRVANQVMQEVVTPILDVFRDRDIRSEVYEELAHVFEALEVFRDLEHHLELPFLDEVADGELDERDQDGGLELAWIGFAGDFHFDCDVVT